MCVRRTYLDKIGIAFVEGIFYEDVIYTLTCYLKAKNMVYIDEKLYIYRKREGSITNTKNYIKAVDSYLFVLAQLLEHLSMERYDAEVEECILKNVAKKMVEEISRRLFTLTSYHPIWKENEISYGLLRNLNIGARLHKFNYQHYLNGFKRLICTASGTIVYGAGGIGKMLGQYFKKENMLDYINSYCVTEKNENSQIEGIEVREIEYIRNFDKDILIIIAANATAYEMELTLKKYGYNNYVIVNGLIEKIISETL
jgi:hypothetical protein